MTATTARIQSAEDLRARIRQLAENEADPARITAAILPTLDDAEAHVVAAVTLHNYVRITVVQPAPESRTYETVSGQRTTSAKVAAVRDWVARELGRSICVNEAEREWKPLADCTVADCQTAAEIRHRKAAQSTAEAERFEKIAAALDEASATTVGELPRETLEAVLR